MSATAQPLTAEELLRMPDDGNRYELISGELTKRSTGSYKHGRIAANIAGSLIPFVTNNKLGIVCIADTGFLLSSNPDTVRAPDVAFIGKSRLEEIGDVEVFFPGPPDLAVEVISPSDSYAEVDEKVCSYLDAGAQMVIVVNPRKRSITVYCSLTDITILTESDVLNGGIVVPGWEMAVRDIFA